MHQDLTAWVGIGSVRRHSSIHPTVQRRIGGTFDRTDSRHLIYKENDLDHMDKAGLVKDPSSKRGDRLTCRMALGLVEPPGIFP